MRIIGFAGLLASAVPPLGAEPPTYHRDIAPMLEMRCTACHRAEGLAPFSLETYAAVRAKAGKLARITLDGLMPPWLPAHGGFLHERRLEAGETALLRRWVEAGAMEGDIPLARALPTKPEWSLGVPDAVLVFPMIHRIPAEGPTHTAHLVFPLAAWKDRHLRAVELRPGNPRVVVEATAMIDVSGQARKLAGSAGWYERAVGAGFLPSAQLPAFAPGVPAQPFGEGVGISMTEQADLVLQVRYRPSGELETDVSSLALYFAPEPPEREVAGVLLANEATRLSPGVGEQTLRDSIVLSAPMEVRELRPQMGRSGREFRAWVELAKGRNHPLLAIQDWDPAWQDTYRLKTPVDLPKGARIVAEWIVAKPSKTELRLAAHDPAEGGSFWVGGVAKDAADRAVLRTANVAHLDRAPKPVRKRK